MLEAESVREAETVAETAEEIAVAEEDVLEAAGEDAAVAGVLVEVAAVDDMAVMVVAAEAGTRFSYRSAYWAAEAGFSWSGSSLANGLSLTLTNCPSAKLKRVAQARDPFYLIKLFNPVVETWKSFLAGKQEMLGIFRQRSRACECLATASSVFEEKTCLTNLTGILRMFR